MLRFLSMSSYPLSCTSDERSSSSSFVFYGGWQTNLTVHYRHRLGWGVNQEILELKKKKKELNPFG